MQYLVVEHTLMFKKHVFDQEKNQINRNGLCMNSIEEIPCYKEGIYHRLFMTDTESEKSLTPSLPGIQSKQA